MTSKVARCQLLSSMIKRRFDDVIKSPEDKRFYRAFELSNNMKVMLISDPETDKSAASLDISIGSMSDPAEIPGLAHFCEHMLFMGTKKYPVENDYDNFLSMHGGCSNAYTTSDHTNYQFDIAHEFLNGAVDRFAQFFVSPTFNPDSSEREVLAVDSEFSNALKNDDNRLFQLEKSLCQQTHDFHKFDYGNKLSLWENVKKEHKLDPRAELLKFYDKFYSANLMSLAVLGKESLDDLAEMIIPLFSEIIDKNVKRPVWPDHPFRVENLKRKLNVVPVKDARKLNLTFPTPDLKTLHRSKPHVYLSHLLGHEGSGGFFAELKRRGWASQICADYHSPASGFGFFTVEIELSPEGFRNVDDTLVLMFQYLRSTLKNGQPIEEWMHRELERLNINNFTFEDKMRPDDYVTHLAPFMHDYALKDVLFSPNYAMPDFNPDLVQNLLDAINPNNMLVAVISKDFEGKTDKTEKWYGTNYSVVPLTQNFIEKCLNVESSPKFSLPNKNEFIPTNFEIFSKFHSEKIVFPQVLHNDPTFRCWYQQDIEFSTPKLCSFVRFQNPPWFSKPADLVACSMLTDTLKDRATDFIYDAHLAGLDLNLHKNDDYGLELKLDGFHEKHKDFLGQILRELTTFEPDPVRFEVLKECYVRKLKNFHKKDPYKQASQYAAWLLYEKSWSVGELQQQAENFTLDDLKKFRQGYLKSLHVEAYIHGNTSKKESQNLLDVLKSELHKFASTSPLFTSQLDRCRTIKLPEGGKYLFESHNTTHENSCTAVMLQTSLENPKNNMLTELTQQILCEQFFNQLRTKEQLGYIVSSSVKNFNGVRSLYFVVQGSKSPQIMENRIDSFLQVMQKKIEKMSQEEFDEHKESLAAIRLDKPKTLSELCEKYWLEITREQYQFDRDNFETKILRDITKEEIIDFYKDFVAEAGAKKKKLSVHIYSTKNWEGRGKNGLVDNKRRKNDAAISINDVANFKSSLPLYETPLPHLDVPLAGLSISEESTTKL